MNKKRLKPLSTELRNLSAELLQKGHFEECMLLANAANQLNFMRTSKYE